MAEHKQLDRMEDNILLRLGYIYREYVEIEVDDPDKCNIVDLFVDLLERAEISAMFLPEYPTLWYTYNTQSIQLETDSDVVNMLLLFHNTKFINLAIGSADSPSKKLVLAWGLLESRKPINNSFQLRSSHGSQPASASKIPATSVSRKGIYVLATWHSVRSQSSDARWSHLPAELIEIISSFVTKGKDLRVFRSVCSSWRSSTQTIPKFPNKLSSICPLRLIPSLFLLDSCPDLACIAPTLISSNGIFLVKKKHSSPFVLSLLEWKPGKLFLCHPLNYEFQIGSSGDTLDSVSKRFSITRLANSHTFKCIPTPAQPFCAFGCYGYSTKLLFLPPTNLYSEAISLCYRTPGCLYAIRNCLTKNSSAQLVSNSKIEDLVNFNSCVYAIDDAAGVHLVHRTTLTMNPLGLASDVVCFDHDPTLIRKRFVVSNGDLYAVFHFIDCEQTPIHRRCYIYKLVIDDIHNPTSYTLERIYDLGDRVFFVNMTCSFSLSIVDLHPLPFVGNLVFVTAAAFRRLCAVDSPIRVYEAVGGKPAMNVPDYSALFQLPQHWYKKMRRRHEGRRKNPFYEVDDVCTKDGVFVDRKREKRREDLVE